ncbi:MAG: NADH-quinone oxidoreductase subunit NuoB [Candidatus Omnitrophica bacterium]|jgi:Ni,Fe-hydrogenase III small subunit|nr:NADH-quinone oxidoreductase subunit NuoB [Candidatus Omnitrophota bacterium]
MNFKTKALTKSIWVFHISAGSCNNCDIEILDLLTPRYDVERFGIQLVGSIRHADVLLITGTMNRKAAPLVKKIYAQAPKPCIVVAVGQCALSQHMFRDSYNVGEPLDKALPVDLYIPGCPPKPEAMIAGIVKLVDKIRGQNADKRRS